MHQILFYNKFVICLYMFRTLCAHHQEVKIVLYSIWYYHACMWPSGVHRFSRGVESSLNLCTGRRVDRFISRPSPYRAVNTFRLGYKSRSVYAVSDTSRCLFSDKYKTHKYSMDRAYSCLMLNWWCIT